MHLVFLDPVTPYPKIVQRNREARRPTNDISEWITLLAPLPKAARTGCYNEEGHLWLGTQLICWFLRDLSLLFISFVFKYSFILDHCLFSRSSYDVFPMSFRKKGLAPIVGVIVPTKRNNTQRAPSIDRSLCGKNLAWFWFIFCLYNIHQMQLFICKVFMSSLITQRWNVFLAALPMTGRNYGEP